MNFSLSRRWVYRWFSINLQQSDKMETFRAENSKPTVLLCTKIESPMKETRSLIFPPLNFTEFNFENTFTSVEQRNLSNMERKGDGGWDRKVLHQCLGGKHSISLSFSYKETEGTKFSNFELQHVLNLYTSCRHIIPFGSCVGFERGCLDPSPLGDKAKGGRFQKGWCVDEMAKDSCERKDEEIFLWGIGWMRK